MVWITRDRTNDRCEMLGQAPRRGRDGDNDTALIEVMLHVDDPGVWHRKEICVRNLTSEYTGLRTTFLKPYGVNGFFLRFRLLVKASKNRLYLHIQVCKISIYPTGRWGDCQSVKRTLNPLPPQFNTWV